MLLMSFVFVSIRKPHFPIPLTPTLSRKGRGSFRMDTKTLCRQIYLRGGFQTRPHFLCFLYQTVFPDAYDVD